MPLTKYQKGELFYKAYKKAKFDAKSNIDMYKDEVDPYWASFITALAVAYDSIPTLTKMTEKENDIYQQFNDNEPPEPDERL